MCSFLRHTTHHISHVYPLSPPPPPISLALPSLSPAPPPSPSYINRQYFIGTLNILVPMSQQPPSSSSSYSISLVAILIAFPILSQHQCCGKQSRTENGNFFTIFAIKWGGHAWLFDLRSKNPVLAALFNIFLQWKMEMSATKPRKISIFFFGLLP